MIRCRRIPGTLLAEPMAAHQAATVRVRKQKAAATRLAKWEALTTEVRTGRLAQVTGPVTARGRVRLKAAASAGLSPFWEASTCALVRVCDVLWRNVKKPASDGNPSRLAPYGGVVALQVGMTHGTTAFSGRCRRCTRRIFTRAVCRAQSKNREVTLLPPPHELYFDACHPHGGSDADKRLVQGRGSRGMTHTPGLRARPPLMCVTASLLSVVAQPEPPVLTARC